MRAAQLVSNPVEIGSKFSLSTHHPYSKAIPSIHKNAHPDIPGRKHFLPFSIASGRTCIDPVR